MFFQSIRFKMILWYMLLLTVTLLSFSSILYGSFNKLLYANLDDLLSSRGEGIANSITTYWSAKNLEVQHDGPKLKDFSSLAVDWVEEKRRDPELMSIFVRVLNRKGELVVASKNMPALEDLDKDDLSDILSGDDDFSTLKGRTADGKNVGFRVYSKPVTDPARAGVEYIVQVAGPASLIMLASKNLFWSLFVLLPLTVILAGLPGVILVRLTLKPVDEMIKTIKQTTAENLKLKIHLPDTKDEIKRLADTFNGMIERLDRSFSSQQSFIQDISAELKAPLEALKKEFGSALKNSLPSDQCAVLLNKALEELDRFERVIEELEALAKFDNNRMALEIRKVNIPALLERALDAVKPDALKKDVSLSSVLKDPIIIDGDEKQLMRLFASLLDNAVKYTNRKGSVAIAVRKFPRSVVITVADTGVGIEEGELPYIFDRFYQVQKCRVSNGSFGLGLSIAKSVSEVHRGTISVESKPGKGSVFTVVLPMSYPA